MRTALLLAIALFGVAGPPRGEIVSSLTPSERERLESGEVLVSGRASETGSGFSVRGIAVVAAPPARVWPVVRDCGYFDRFMPRTKDSAQVRVDDHTTTCSLRVDLPFPLGEFASKVRSIEQRLSGGGYQRTWSLIEGDYHRSEGAWMVLPWGTPDRTLLIYEQEAEPKTSVPGTLLRLGQERFLPGSIEAIRQRVRDTDVAAGAPTP